MTSLFLSYAREDDEPFVSRLHHDLVGRGFDIWWDRVAMSSRGLTFLHEIRDAINVHERFLLVLGPKAAASDHVVAEWQHAVIYGKPVTPILRVGDYLHVPDELKLLHVEDFREDARYAFHLENLVRQLSEPVAPMGKLVGVPGLPRHLLTRSECLMSLNDAVRADLQRPVVVTGAAARVGVHGMGGIGKSVVANLLARDTEVRRAFPDGIVWVPLGTTPKLVELQRNVAKAFVEEPGHFDNVAQGRAKLTELLMDKAVLLVLDDVWERVHAEAFSVLGSRCRAVITTRDAGLVNSIGGAQHEVQLLTDLEALTLLGNAAELSPDALPSDAKEIVIDCGRLPLAVALCAGMFNRGVSWSSILQRLRQAEFEGIADRNAENEQHRSLWTAMKVSLDALTPEEQRRFIELSVFPNGELVPEAAVRTLWSHTGGLDALACEDLLISLSERSLVRLVRTTPQTGQEPHRRVSLHDLLHDFATKLAGDPVPLHNQLLDAYRITCSSDWPSGPNDGYFFDHLRRHLVEAQQVDELYRLLLDLAWLEKKAAIGLVFDLPHDYTECLRACPADDPRRRHIVLLEQAIRRDIHFIARHPSTLFQCLWNSGWWYDCRDAAQHYESADGLWNHLGDKLSTLLEAWRAKKDHDTPGFVWVRSKRPPPTSLGSAELAVLRGHEYQVRSVAITSDGRRIISGSIERTVRVWDSRSGAELAVLSGHEDWVTSVAVTPDGRRIISGSDDKTVRVWDGTSGAELAVLSGHDDEVTSVAVTPDGRRIISGSDDKTVRVWDGTSGAELAMLSGHDDEVTSVAVTPDGGRIISGSEDNTVRIWDGTSGVELAVLRGHDFMVNSVAITADGSRIISGSNDQTVRVWDTVSAAELAVLRGHEDVVISVAVTPDGHRIISGSRDDTVRMWDGASGAELAVLRGHEDAVVSVAVTLDGGLIISGSWDKTVRMWDGTSRAEAAVPHGHEDGVSSVAVTLDGGRIISGSWDKTVRVWDGTSGAELRVLREHEWWVTSVAVTPDGGRIIGGSADSTVRVWDGTNGTELAVLRGHKGQVRSVAVTPDGACIVSGSWDKTVRVWDGASGTELAVLRHEDWVTSVAVTPDGRRIISGSNDKTVRVWDGMGGAELAVLSGHDDKVRSVAVTPDGRRIISGSDDYTVRVWDGTSGAELAVFRGHEGGVTRLAVTHDGSRVISASIDETRVWDVATGACREVFHRRGDLVAIGAGSIRYPYRALDRASETVIEKSVSGHEIAAFPAPLDYLSTHPSGRTWVGASGNHLYFITLEGDA